MSAIRKLQRQANRRGFKNAVQRLTTEQNKIELADGEFITLREKTVLQGRTDSTGQPYQTLPGDMELADLRCAGCDRYLGNNNMPIKNGPHAGARPTDMTTFCGKTKKQEPVIDRLRKDHQ